MSLHLHHSAFGSSRCDHSSCLDDDYSQNVERFETLAQQRERKAEEATAAKLAAYPPYVLLEPKRPKKRRPLPTVKDIIGWAIAVPVALFWGIAVLSIAVPVVVGICWGLWQLFSVIFLGAGGCSMQGGTC